MPDREELLERDPKTGIAHPKPYWKKQRWGVGQVWYESQYLIVAVFTAVVFVGSFFV